MALFTSPCDLPLVRSYGDICTVTLSPGRILIKFIRSLPEMCARMVCRRRYRRRTWHSAVHQLRCPQVRLRRLLPRSINPLVLTIECLAENGQFPLRNSLLRNLSPLRISSATRDGYKGSASGRAGAFLRRAFSRRPCRRRGRHTVHPCRPRRTAALLSRPARDTIMFALDSSIFSKPLSNGENFRLAVGNQNRVFVVSRELAIGSYSRPFVLQDRTSYVPPL